MHTLLLDAACTHGMCHVLLVLQVRVCTYTAVCVCVTLSDEDRASTGRREFAAVPGSHMVWLCVCVPALLLFAAVEPGRRPHCMVR